VALLIDTSVLIDSERGGGALHRVPDEAERMISVITVSELLHGVHRAKADAVRHRRQGLIEDALAEVQPTPVTVEIARVHAAIWAQLESAGETIGMHDLWIAATALTYHATVVTLNPRDFRRVPGLDVVVV
jgi:tRNA(fMet)-specific endonuclease VapC